MSFSGSWAEGEAGNGQEVLARDRAPRSVSRVAAAASGLTVLALAVLTGCSEGNSAPKPKKLTKEKQANVAAKAEVVSFSHTRGFYETPFELILTGRGSDSGIRFTTDGSA